MSSDRIHRNGVAEREARERPGHRTFARRIDCTPDPSRAAAPQAAAPPRGQRRRECDDEAAEGRPPRR